MANQTTPAIQVKDSNVGIGTASPLTALHVIGLTTIEESGNIAFYGGNFVRVFNDQNFNIRNVSGTTVANISVNGASYFNGGNVGIGTTGPTNTLDVLGSATIRNSSGGGALNIGTNSGRTEYQYITLGGGTGGTDYGWQVGRSSQTGGVINDGFYIYDIKTNNAPFAIALGGNVGIGTTSPLYGLNIKKTNTPALFLETPNGAGNETGLLMGSSFETNYIKTGIFYKQTDASYYIGDIHFALNGAQTSTNVSTSDTKMIIKSSGNVGIGTTAPDAKLEIAQSTDNTDGPTLRIANNANTLSNGQLIGAIDFYNGDDSGTGNAVGAYIRSYTANAVLPVSSQYLSFAAGGSTETIRLNSSGNLSIGNTNDTYKLDVSGTGRFSGSITSNASGVGTLLLGSTSGSSQIAGRITATESPSYTATGKIGFSVTTWGAGTDYGLTEVMAIDMRGADSKAPTIWMNPFGGNVGIGTTSPISYSGYTTLGIDNASSGGVVDFMRSGTSTFRIGADSTGNFLYGATSLPMVFSTNTNERMRITSGGSVLIATSTNPYTLGSLVVSHDSTLTRTYFQRGVELIEIAPSDGTGPNIISSSYTSSGSAYKPLSLSGRQNNADLYLTTSGNVGIGTTAPSGARTVIKTPGVNDANEIALQLNHGDGGLIANQEVQLGFGQGDGTTSLAQIGASYEGSSFNGSLIFRTNSASLAERMRITSAGNVGIGTTAPAEKLQVIGNIGVGAGTYNGGVYANSSTTGIDSNWGFDFLYTTGQSDYSTRLKYYPVTGESRKGGIWNSRNNDWVLYGDSNNTPNVIVPSGNVGIGTTAPVNKLQVTSASNDVEVLRVDNTAGNSGSVQGVTHLGLNFFGAGNNSGARITAYQNGTSGYAGGMYFSTRSVNSDSAPTEAMRITHDQLIGLGPVSSFTSTHRVWIDKGSSTYAVYSQGSIQVNAGAIGVGVTPSATSGRIDAGNDIVAYSTSDQRLKENITPIANALDKVKALTGVEFDWKEKTKEVHGYEGHDVGVIAQEVQAVLPEAVRTNDSGYLSVRYEKMIALLVEANKELASRVEELEKKLK